MCLHEKCARVETLCVMGNLCVMTEVHIHKQLGSVPLLGGRARHVAHGQSS